MAEASKQPDQAVVDEFLASETHAGRVSLFKKYPALHAAFRIAHFEHLAELEAGEVQCPKSNVQSPGTPGSAAPV